MYRSAGDLLQALTAGKGFFARARRYSGFTHRALDGKLRPAAPAAIVYLQEVPFPQHHDMVETLASDRSDQPFDMPVLPR